MVRQHDFKQLPVETFRLRLDFTEIEPWFDVKIIGGGAMLEVEVDQASRSLSARATVKQEHRGLHR